MKNYMGKHFWTELKYSLWLSEETEDVNLEMKHLETNRKVDAMQLVRGYNKQTWSFV